jgi:hypothetical protein
MILIGTTSKESTNKNLNRRDSYQWNELNPEFQKLFWQCSSSQRLVSWRSLFRAVFETKDATIGHTRVCSTGCVMDVRCETSGDIFQPGVSGVPNVETRAKEVVIRSSSYVCAEKCQRFARKCQRSRFW